MYSVAVVVDLEGVQLSRQISRVPEERAVKVLTPEGPDQSFDEGMRLREVGDRLELFDLKDAKVGQPAVKAEQGIVVGTDAPWHRLAGSRVIEPATDAAAIDSGLLDSKADDAARADVHYPHGPVAAKQDGLASKQIHAPEAVFRLGEKRQPGWAHGPRMLRAPMPREHAPDSILVDLNAKREGDLLGNAQVAKPRIAVLELDDGGDEFCRRSFRAGLTRRTGRGKEQPILTVNQRSVKSEQGGRLENSRDFIDATRAYE